MSGSVLRRWPMLVTLVVMWIALWGDLSVANVVGGAIIAVVVLAFADQVKPGPVHHFQVAAALRYLWTFFVQLLVANWQVARAVIAHKRIMPGILAMPLSHASDAVVTLVANSITLTPGTLTLETDRRGDVAILYVHSLDVSDSDSVREDVCELEVRAVDAFAGPDAQAVQARTLAELEQGDEPEASASPVVWPDSGAAGEAEVGSSPERAPDPDPARADDGDDGEDQP